MRMLLIVGVIIALGWACYQRFQRPLTSGPAKPHGSEASGRTGPEFKDFVGGVRPAQPSQSSTPGLAVDQKAITEPLVWGRYKFEHRSAIDQTILASWTTYLATAVVDPVSREVVIRGPESVVKECVDWCKRSDVLAQSCVAHAWTIYVDQNVQKGFDLVAAIKAVSGSSFEATIGDGAVTLDLGIEELQTAVTAIADGTVVEVVQNPFVRLVDGAPATIESIQELPVPEAVVSNGISQKSVKFRKVGLQLQITPAFRASDRVTLDVAQTNGVVGAPVTIDGNQIPVVESQNVTSRVDLKVGETVVLGGVRTFRNRRVRGLLRNTTERSEGALYVVLSTYYDAPKALPVTPLPPPAFGDPWVPPVPGGGRIPPAAEWIDGQLLPPVGWERENVLPIGGKSRK